MNKHFWFLFYNIFFIPIFYLITKLLSLFNSNVRESLYKRKKLWPRLEKNLSKREWKKPLIWFHVASAGEYLQATPVIRRCILKGAECLLTFSSINAYKWIKNERKSNFNEILSTEFLPFDSVSNAKRLVGLIQPSRVIWISYDLWPNLIWELEHQEIPQSLISAIVHKDSPRTKNIFGRSFYKSIYDCLEHILTVSDADRKRILLSNPEHNKVKVMGEIRCDSVIERRASIKIPELPLTKKSIFVFIAASTWPKDEKCIFPGLKEALIKYPELFLILAPHEPNDKNLKNAENYFKNFKNQRFSKMESPNDLNRILLIDRVGVLAGLYHYAHMAFVGGAFTSGVHNILEPASMKSKIAFGPKYNNSREAVEMVQQKLAFSVNNSTNFNKLLFDSLSNRNSCIELGKKSCEYIEKQVGATDICVPYIMGNII